MSGSPPPLSVNEPERAPLIETIKGPPRTIGLVQLVVLSYFITCGGPFGIEPAVGAGGALYTCIGLIVIIVFWCLPQAVMSAELALLCSSKNGGSILWVERAMGDAANFINMFTLLFASAALSLALFGNYLSSAPSMGPVWISWVTKVGVVIISLIINIAGPQMIAYISAGLMVVMFVPFVAMCVQLGIEGKYGGALWTESMVFTPAFDTIQWGVLISTLVWALGILISVPLSLCTYAFPILLCIVAEPVDGNNFGGHGTMRNDWGAGGYTKIAQEVQPWLGYLMIAAACFAMVGQTVSGTAVLARQLQCTSATITPRFLGYAHPRNGAPIVAIVVASVSIFGMSAIPFNTLAQVFMLQRVITLFFCYIALTWLRVTEPKTERPFRTPFGIAGCVGLLVPTAVLSFFVVYFMRDSLVWLISGSVEIAIVLAYVARLIYLKCTGSKVVVCRTKRVKSADLSLSCEEEATDAAKAE